MPQDDLTPLLAIGGIVVIAGIAYWYFTQVAPPPPPPGEVSAEIIDVGIVY